MTKTRFNNRPLNKQKNSKIFKCKKCPKQNLKNELLVKYIESDYKKVKLFKCQMCQRIFLFKSNLTNHMSTHTQTFFVRCNQKTDWNNKKNNMTFVIDSCKKMQKLFRFSTSFLI